MEKGELNPESWSQYYCYVVIAFFTLSSFAILQSTTVQMYAILKNYTSILANKPLRTDDV